MQGDFYILMATPATQFILSQTGLSNLVLMSTDEMNFNNLYQIQENPNLQTINQENAVYSVAVTISVNPSLVQWNGDVTNLNIAYNLTYNHFHNFNTDIPSAIANINNSEIYSIKLDHNPWNCSTVPEEYYALNITPPCRLSDCSALLPHVANASTTFPCGISCDANYDDTNNDWSDGCECSTLCNTLPEVDSAVCGGQGCEILQCTYGFLDCDTLFENGCEQSMDDSHCNLSCDPCNPSDEYHYSTCSNYTCIENNCGVGTANCDLTGFCEVTINATSCPCTNCPAPPLDGYYTCDQNPLPHCAAICSNLSYTLCDNNTACYDLNSDLQHCGDCNKDCEAIPPINVNISECANGKCTIVECYPTYAACGTFVDGCAVKIGFNDSCGNCDGQQNCSAIQNAQSVNCISETPTNYHCSAVCTLGFMECNGNLCDTNINDDLHYCGNCTNDCTTYYASWNATSGVCEKGECKVQNCLTGYLDCDLITGCEVQITDSNCGGCGSFDDCTALNHADGSCDIESGTCSILYCHIPYADCDGNPYNGCEVDTSSDSNNCNTCGNKCNVDNGSMICSNSACLLTSCYPGYDQCIANQCNSITEVTSCGNCGTNCNDNNVNAIASCVFNSSSKNYECQYTCIDSYYACNTSEPWDCDSNVDCDLCNSLVCDSDAHTDFSCVIINAIATCQYSCNSTGYQICPPNQLCNTSLEDVNHCGTCDNDCTSLPNTDYQECFGGVCVFSCSSTFKDCNLFPNDGCETNITTIEDCNDCHIDCLAAVNNSISAECTYSNLSKGYECVNYDCIPGYSYCIDSKLCIETDNDPQNCGDCNNVCELTNVAVAGCQNSKCTVELCEANTADCNYDPSDGCEVNYKESISNCGYCGNNCVIPGGEVVAATCEAGICKIELCNDGYLDCNFDAADGCETEITTIGNCGNCTQSCDVPNAENFCIYPPGSCSFSCHNSYMLCGNDCIFVNDISNCGQCGHNCYDPVYNMKTANCSNQKCVEKECKEGYKNCDAFYGCETDITTTLNCGDCQNQCNVSNANNTCTISGCSFECNEGYFQCGNECISSFDPYNCGGCKHSCLNFQVLSAICNNSTCEIVMCAPGFADCDKKPENGCEVFIYSSLNNCGACNNTCNLQNHTSDVSCSAATCEIFACAQNYSDCDSNYNNGCETDLSSVQSCGTCGNNCTQQLPHSTTGCIQQTSECYIQECDVGWKNCTGKGKLQPGCSTNIQTTSNCGDCNNDCSQLPNTFTTYCLNMSCQILACNPNWGNCNNDSTDGCETQLNTPLHCGSCGNNCLSLMNVANAACITGTNQCSILQCQDGWLDCNKIATDGCETADSTILNCGECNNNCNRLPHVSASFCNETAKACQIIECESGFFDCNHIVPTFDPSIQPSTIKQISDGCETSNPPQQCLSQCLIDCTLLPHVQNTICNNAECVIVSCGEGFDNCNDDFSDGCEFTLSPNCFACNTICQGDVLPPGDSTSPTTTTPPPSSDTPNSGGNNGGSGNSGNELNSNSPPGGNSGVMINPSDLVVNNSPGVSSVAIQVTNPTNFENITFVVSNIAPPDPNLSNGGKIGSNIADINVITTSAATSTLSTTNYLLPEPIQLCFVVNQSDVTSHKKKNSCLGYYDTTQNPKVWKCEDHCLKYSKSSDGNVVACGDTPHLTSFAILFGGVANGAGGACGDNNQDYILGDLNKDLILIGSVAAFIVFLGILFLILFGFTPLQQIVRGKEGTRIRNVRNMRSSGNSNLTSSDEDDP